MGRLFFLGFAAILLLVLSGCGLLSSFGDTSAAGQRRDAGMIVELPDAGEQAVRETGGAGPAANLEDPSFEDDGHAYLDEIESFGREYVEVIGETGSLMHLLVHQSRGVDRMDASEARKLGDLLSKMEDAPEAGVVASYHEGYEDCARHLRAGAYSLRFAAGAIRNFNRTADAEYLDEYTDLIGMHLQAVSSAKSCAADHLYPIRS